MTSKDIYTELNAFMGRMRDGETREMVENLQAAIEYQAEKLRIYEEKYKEATGKERPELNDSDRKRLAGKARTLNTHLLQLTDNHLVAGYSDGLVSQADRRKVRQHGAGTEETRTPGAR